MGENTDWVAQYDDDPRDDLDGRSRPPIWVVVVVVFAVAFGVWLLVTQGFTDTDPTTSPTLLPVTTTAESDVETTTPPTTEVPATPNPVAGSVSVETLGCEIPSGWFQVCDPATFNRGVMYAVTAGGPGLVAVGSTRLDYYTRDQNAELFTYGEGTPGTADAAVWASSDGFTWVRVPDDVDTFGGDGSQQMLGVTAGGPGLVAVGRDGPAVDGEGDAAVWTSPDGFTWTRVMHDETVFGGQGEQRMVSVTAGGPGLVAIGFERPAEEGQGNAAVWTSPDGFTWTRVVHDEAVFGGENRQMMLGVTAGGPGLVAVGTDGNSYDADDDQPIAVPDELAADAAVWTSPDGFAWSRVRHDEAIFGGLDEQRMNSVTGGGPGLVAVGSVTGQSVGGNAHDAAVWTSTDGLTWSRVPHDVAVFGSSHEDQMLSVVAGGPGLVAVGFDSADQCGWDSAVWTSPDGFTWSRVPDERGCGGQGGPYDRMLGVAVGTSGLAAVGEEHGETEAAAVWLPVSEGMTDIDTISFMSSDWAIRLDDMGAGIHHIDMIVMAEPLSEADVDQLAGRLVWAETTVDLCRIEVRAVGVGFLHIGDGFETTEGCGDNPTEMQDAVDEYGPPDSGCLTLVVRGSHHHYCAPLD